MLGFRALCLPGPGFSKRRATFSPTSLFAGGEQGAWYDASDLATLFQTGTRASPGTAVTADGDPVGLMLDKSGNNNDLFQATAGKRPLYKTSGGLRWLQFDGVDDFLQTAAFVGAQPIDRVSALRQITYVFGGYLFNGRSSSTIAIWQRPSTPIIGLYSGAAGDNLDNGGLAVGADGVTTERHNGASSSLQVNNNTATTGNPGATGWDGITIGGAFDGTLPASIRLYATVMRVGTMSAGEKASLKTYVGAKAGVSV